ncbi:MAG: glycosyltransferase [Trichodesmium sp. MAG_R03]|nr:glycosyltransferase [Trichodesmium sp. MAG_R03]
MSKCSIVIRCYNEEQHIGRLLSGIIQQTVPDPEIIIVDSGSTDATVSIASRYPVKILSITPEEFSFGRALNIGCRAATGDIIVIASAHVYPLYFDWLENLLTPFDRPEVALVYGQQRGNEITKYSEHQVFAKWFPDIPDYNQTHPFCNNANAAIRRLLWEKLPYDETLTGLEDLDWAQRIQKLGYKIVYEPEAPIVHVHDEPPSKIYNRYRREAIALKNIFPQEQFHLWNFIRLFLGNTISDYYHAGSDRVLWKNLTQIFQFRLMQFWGTYQGFRQYGIISSQLKQTFYYPHSLTRSRTSQTKSNPQQRAIDYSKSEARSQKSEVRS